VAELNDSAGSPFANIYFSTIDSDQHNIIEAETIPEVVYQDSFIEPLINNPKGGLGEYNIKDAWGGRWQS